MNKFINLNANIDPPQPYGMKGATMTTFVFQVAMDKLQSICDKWLNQATGGALYFEPVVPFAHVIFSNYAGAAPTTPPYSDYGSVAYKEVIITLLIGRYDVSGGEKKLQEVYMLADYCWVDTDFTMLGGREVYGMLKTMGSISFPLGSEQKYALSSQSFNRYGIGAPAVPHELLSITGTSDVQITEQSTDVKEAADLLMGVLKELYLPHFSFSLLEEFIRLIFEKDVPFISLRQLRSIQTPEDAVYQEIVSFNSKIQKLHSLKIFNNNFIMTLDQIATFPVAADYGWDLQANNPVLVIQTETDFVFESGTAIWQSTEIT